MKNLKIGDSVYSGERPVVILEIIGLESALIAAIESKETEVVALTDLSLNPLSLERMSAPLAGIDKYEWAMLVQKFKILKPLLENIKRTEEDVRSVAKIVGVSSRTIYRWIERYNQKNVISALMRSVRADKGKRLLDVEIENVIDSQIREYYLTFNRPSVQKLYERIEEKCKRLNLSPPHKNTVANRVSSIPEELKAVKRLGAKKAHEIHTPHRGSFPGGDFPNAVVQIDHTPVDIILVDSQHRLPIGRPYLTLALDVATKMVTGYYLSLDHPGTLSACLCISHAVQRKDMWLSQRNIDATWPIHGKMVKIHMDNAKEFRGNSIKRACQEHGVILEWRPKGQPNYGPQIERSFRTYMDEVHTLEGTTFSNVVKKVDYDSEGKACMTLEEFDRWFAIFLSNKYHNKPHKGISDMAPLKRYERFVHGTDTELGVGYPAVIDDEEKFRLDFMPYRLRTVQQSGVDLHYISYYAPVLRSFIGEKKPGTKKSLQFHCSYDPRDLSYIYFYDPDARIYHKIPYSNASHPPISLWEHRAVMNKIKSQADYIIDEESIFRGAAEMRKIEQDAIANTIVAKSRRSAAKRHLRTAERRLGWSKAHEASIAPVQPEPSKVSDYVDTDCEVFEPFDDIDVQ